MAICVGFDLDMTLIDPRPGMVLAMDALAREAGLALDGERFAANLGPPLQQVLRGFETPEERIPELVTRFREMYPDLVVPRTVALPGAEAALAAVHADGGRTLVVTGKYEPNAALHVEAHGLAVDALVGDLWATGKAAALKTHHTIVYVGDHIGDMHGARAAGAMAVGVLTGPCTRRELLAAGAHVVLGSLAEFPAWLAGVRRSGTLSAADALARGPQDPARDRAV
ncbi:HAD family hydrolase [Qaidamihabitans albus]|uniref:HAD family hydrolase n=1 Tax=Qaidamihabitans albus TaxID=2795733 RepID=UPI0018F14730|nr:HAD family hydrolase [Qaidamihabitans albus]